MIRKTQFHFLQALFNVFSYLADKTGGWLVFVRPKLIIGSLLMGLGLTACNQNSPSSIEKKQKDNIKQAQTTCYDVQMPPPPPPPQTLEQMLGIEETEEEKSVIHLHKKHGASTPVITCYEQVPDPEMFTREDLHRTDTLPMCYVIEEMPFFPEEEKGRIEFIKKNMVYPQDAIKAKIEGTVYCQFTIDSTGAISDAKILRGLYSSIDAEAIRIIKMMPKWMPGKQSGKKVKVLYTMPIIFELPKDSTIVNP